MMCALLCVRGTEMKGPCAQITFILLDMLPCDTDSAPVKVGVESHSSSGDLDMSEKPVLVKWMFDLILEG